MRYDEVHFEDSKKAIAAAKERANERIAEALLTLVRETGCYPRAIEIYPKVIMGGAMLDLSVSVK